jgi:hypothetical protein
LKKDEPPTFQITVTGSATAYSVDNSEPTRTATAKLKQERTPGMSLDEKSTVVALVIPPNVQQDGVHWRVRVEGKQKPEPNKSQMAAALAGRESGYADQLAKQLGFTLRRVTLWPDWWPRLPVLDSRITIDVEALPPSASSP